jgi:hypothetical protein
MIMKALLLLLLKYPGQLSASEEQNSPSYWVTLVKNPFTATGDVGATTYLRDDCAIRSKLGMLHDFSSKDTGSSQDAFDHDFLLVGNLALSMMPRFTPGWYSD